MTRLSLCPIDYNTGGQWWENGEEPKLTSQQERDEACILGHVQFEAGAAEDVLHHGLWAAGPLQEGQELSRLLCVLTDEEWEREGGERVS